MSKPEAPKGTLSKKQMTAILVDIHLLESKIDRLRLKPDSAEIVYAHFESQIFEKHGVDPDNYRESLRYYTEVVDEFYTIYEGVVDSLMVREKNHNME